MNKAENIKEYQEFCKRNRLVEDSTTVSQFCEWFRRKETLANSRAIAQLYKYIGV